MVLLPDFTVCQLQRGDGPLMRSMMAMFGDAFKEADTYTGTPPGAAYVERLLGGSQFIALAATQHGMVVGGLVAYELHKFEQERTEIYIYDLAVAEAHRRRGIATALIGELKALAVARNAYTIFVQADRADAPAIALYSKLGTRAEVLHFDIGMEPPTTNSA